MTIGKLIVQRDNIVSYDNFIFKILDDMPVREALKYQNDEEKNEFFNSFIYRVVLFDDCVYIFYNTSPDAPTKVKLDTGICSCLLQSSPCEIFLCFAKAFGLRSTLCCKQQCFAFVRQIAQPLAMSATLDFRKCKRLLLSSLAVSH